MYGLRFLYFDVVMLHQLRSALGFCQPQSCRRQATWIAHERGKIKNALAEMYSIAVRNGCEQHELAARLRGGRCGRHHVAVFTDSQLQHWA